MKKFRIPILHLAYDTISAKKSGAKDVLILDRNSWLGGILPQCIHDGFGVEETGLSMTGPEYAEKYITEAERLGIQLLNETMVLQRVLKRLSKNSGEVVSFRPM